MRLNDRKALVTGAASGIGRATARLFVEEGARVVCVDIDEQEGRRLEAELGDAARFIVADVADAGQVQTTVDEAADHLGGLDTVFANAGINIRGSLDELEISAIDRVVDVNLKGIAYVCKFAIPHLRRAGGGSIVLTGSNGAFIGFPRNSIYNATKGGIVMLTKAMSVDYAREGIRVNAICPGLIDTPLARRWMEYETDPDAVIPPAGRWGRPEEIAEAVVWLSSDEADFVRGTTLVADGGAMA